MTEKTRTIRFQEKLRTFWNIINNDLYNNIININILIIITKKQND